MAFAFQNQLDEAAERRSPACFATLSEKDQRRFTALEAQRLGRGGIIYIAKLLGVSRSTIERGIVEFEQLPVDPTSARVRRPGGGRKKNDSDSELQSNLIGALQLQTAGDPDDPDAVFTSQTPSQTADKVTQQGTPIDRNTVKAWYREIGLGLRQMRKDLAGGRSPDRQEQFERIGELTAQYESDGNPVFSIDTKAKEFLGHLSGNGCGFDASNEHTNGTSSHRQCHPSSLPTWSETQCRTQI